MAAEKGVKDLLIEASVFWEKRNKAYGHSYRDAAKIMRVLFPKGITLNSEEDYQRMQLLEMIVAKLARYAKQWHKLGDHDTTFDLSIYAMMLTAIEDEIREEALSGGKQ